MPSFLGIMKCVLYKRTNLKLILMSATINLNLFTSYFSEENIEVIQVSIFHYKFAI